MRALCQPELNPFCVSSEQTSGADQPECISGRGLAFRSRKAEGLRAFAAVSISLILLNSDSFLSQSQAQESVNELPVKAVAPPSQTARGFGSQVDESLRFGVSARELYERIEPALVEILWGGVTSRINTMGFKIDVENTYATVIPDGVSSDVELVLRGNGLEQDGKVAVIDKATGLCLVKVAGRNRSSSPALALRPTGDLVHPGTLVFSVNRPGTGAADVCVPGRLAGRDSEYHGLELPTSFYRINMHLIHGALGSPLLDESGGVVGVLTGRRLKESSEHHALPSPVLEKLIRDHNKEGRSSRAWIGASFHLKSTTPQVMSVREGSPAALCGLRSGDVILRVGNMRVADLSDLVDVFYVASIGQHLDLEVLRGIEKLKMKLVPGKIPDASASTKPGAESSANARRVGGRSGR